MTEKLPTVCLINGVRYSCRTCFDPGSSIFSLTDVCSNNKTWRDLLREVAQLQATEDDILPNTICSKCLDKLITFYDFILQIKNVNNKYLELLGNAKDPLEQDAGNFIENNSVNNSLDMPMDDFISDIKTEKEELGNYDIILSNNSKDDENGSSGEDNKTTSIQYEDNEGYSSYEENNDFLPHKKPKQADDLNKNSMSVWYDKIRKINNRFVCPKCKKTFTTLLSCRRHLNTAHFAESNPESSNVTENSQLDMILEKLNIVDVKPYLIRADITFESLKYLSKDDIKEAIPSIGLRACFREKLFYWRKQEYGIEDDTVFETIAGKVASWFQSQKANVGITSTTISSAFPTSVGNSKLSKSLNFILEQSVKGKSLINFYKNNGHLNDSLRADLINIILEDIFYHDTKLSPTDFPKILDEIIENFPSEIKEYYFVPRIGKNNPRGKLWDKYVNQKSKRARYLAKPEINSEAFDSSSQTENSEYNESVLLAWKALLSKELSDWNDVKVKWKNTYPLRQSDIKSTKNNYEFLNEWPLYSNVKCHELVNIDFDLLYRDKGQLLFSKWNVFKEKMEKFYNINIKDKKSKEMFLNTKNITNQNTLDFIYTILLNSVILPTARFSDKGGKNLRKISIPDANESFVIHLTTINNYENVITEINDKYYNRDLTIQPFILVVGDSIYSIDKCYVYFNKTLLIFDTFLKSLDVCFKILQTLSLEYPKGCLGPWLFIQEHFYEIKINNNNINLSSIYSLLNYFKT